MYWISVLPERAGGVQIHDQGAGGNCNVVKEIIYPLGAEIDIRQIKLGDATMSVLEIWGAEYQENDCILIHPEDRAALQAICDRERTYMQVRSRPVAATAAATPSCAKRSTCTLVKAEIARRTRPCH